MGYSTGREGDREQSRWAGQIFRFKISGGIARREQIYFSLFIFLSHKIHWEEEEIYIYGRSAGWGFNIWPHKKEREEKNEEIDENGKRGITDSY